MGHLQAAKNQVYLALAQRLDQNPIGAPLNETLLKILHHLYTENQALIGSKFPHNMTSFEELVTIMGINSAELADQLNDMANKGLVLDLSRKGTTYYMLSPAVIGFFEYTFMRSTGQVPLQEMAELFKLITTKKVWSKNFLAPTPSFSRPGPMRA